MTLKELLNKRSKWLPLIGLRALIDKDNQGRSRHSHSIPFTSLPTNPSAPSVPTEKEVITLNSLNDEELKEEIIVNLMEEINPKGSDVFGIFKDMLNTFQEFLLTLNLEQHIALANLFSDIFIFSCLVTIVTIFYGDLMIKYFNLEEKYPRLAKLIQLRRKFQTYSLTLNIALIFAMLTCVVLYNLYIIFYMH